MASFQTTGLMRQLAEIRAREAAADEIRSNATTPAEIEACDAEDERIFKDLWGVYMLCRIMPDTPQEELVPILRVHVLDRGGEKAWCEYAAKKGAPKLDPAWLKDYIADHMAGRPREYDPTVHKAMVISDGRVILPGNGGVVDVDTGKPVKVA